MSKAKVERRHCVVNPFKPNPMWNHQHQFDKKLVEFRIIEGGAQLFPNGTVGYQGKKYPSLHVFRSLYLGESQARTERLAQYESDSDDQDQEVEDQLFSEEQDFEEPDRSSMPMEEEEPEVEDVQEEEESVVDELLLGYEESLKESAEMEEIYWNVLDEDEKKVVLECKAEMIRLREARILELEEAKKPKPKLPEAIVRELEILESIDSSEDGSCSESGSILVPSTVSTITAQIHDQGSPDSIGTEVSRDSGCQLTEDAGYRSWGIYDEKGLTTLPVLEDMDVDEERMSAAEQMEIDEVRKPFETTTADQTVLEKFVEEEIPLLVAAIDKQAAAEVAGSTLKVQIEVRQENQAPTVNGYRKAAVEIEEKQIPEPVKFEAHQEPELMDTSPAVLAKHSNLRALTKAEVVAVKEEMKLEVVPQAATVIKTLDGGPETPVKINSATVIPVAAPKNGKGVDQTEGDQREEFVKPKKQKVAKLPMKLRVPASTRTLRSSVRQSRSNKFTTIEHDRTSSAQVPPIKSATVVLPPTPPQAMASKKTIFSSGIATRVPGSLPRISSSDSKLEVLLRRAHLGGNLAMAHSTEDKFLKILPQAKLSRSTSAFRNFDHLSYFSSMHWPFFSINGNRMYKKCSASGAGPSTPAAARSSSVPSFVRTA